MRSHLSSSVFSGRQKRHPYTDVAPVLGRGLGTAEDYSYDPSTTKPMIVTITTTRMKIIKKRKLTAFFPLTHP